MGFEYKCIGAPEKAKRKRGAKTRTDRVAVALEEALAEHAVDGWEYLRTDLIPIEERSGMFGRPHEVHRAVMIFRRPLGGAVSHQAPVMAPRPEPVPAPEEPIRLAAERETPAPDATVRPSAMSRQAPKGLG